MTDELKVGSRVVVKDKNLEGTVKFIGTTLFAPGKWIGVELDDPKGKNNGVVQGKTYFQCEDNHGLMVRQNQLQVLPEPKQTAPSQFVSRIPGPSHSGIPTPSSKRPSSGGKRPSPQGPSTSSSPKQGKNAPPATRLQFQGSPQVGRKDKEQVVVAPESSKPKEVSGNVAAAGIGEAPVPDEVTDLNQRLTILQAKRADDKARIKELEKYKAQYLQMTEYKQRWSESQSDLQQQLKAAIKDVREHQLAKEKAEEEMRDLSDTVEMATLDKEMAEERCESLQLEIEALKESVEELTIELEIIKQEISEGGVEGAAANAQFKQMEQQNSRLKEALVRLRDLSAQDKMEHQRTIKDLEKNAVELNQTKEQKDKIANELQEADSIIDELKEQVDAALGAEEMVEKLTDTNLELEEKMAALTEQVTDLEALRDLSEEQEELRMEVEHDLREELDMTQNNIRHMERKLDATQETIVDQQQTIEKFRNLVHNLNSDLAELRSKGERAAEGREADSGDGTQSEAAMMNINVPSKSFVKAQSRTIDFELRQLEARQAAEHINLLISFMPNSFLVSGGDYDALLILMMLPRMSFKAELIIEQLKQQHKFDDALGSLSTVTPSKADQLAFVSVVIYKLTTLNMLTCKANSILKECDMQLYRQMGGVRDDLNIHEKALDIFIELLKKEQLDDSVPLHGIDKAISHFETLLDGRLKQEEGSILGCSSELTDQMQVVSIGCDVITLQLLRIRGLVSENNEFVAQLKEMDSFNNDLRQSSRKVRRKVPSANSNTILLYDNAVVETLSKVLRRQLLLTEAFKALHLRASQRANSLTDGEKLTTGELEEFTRQVISSGTLQEVGSEVTSQQPKEMLRKALSLCATTIEKFLSELSEGSYDSPRSKIKVDAPVVMRARTVKAELSDVEGLGFKLEERQQDILQLKKNLKMKAQELSESNVKIGLLEKKVESIDSEIARQVAVEKEETARMKQAMENQENQFQQTVAILQGDIEALENERMNLEKKLDQTSRKGVLGDLKLTTRIRTLGGSGSPYGSSPYQSPVTSPYGGRRGAGNAVLTARASDSSIGDGAGSESTESVEQSPLLLSRIESLNKALGFSMNENFRLKAQIAKAQLNSLAPLKVPQQLLIRKSTHTDSPQAQDTETGSENVNQTDQEKTVLKRTAALIEDLKRMCLSQVIPSKKVSSQPEVPSPPVQAIPESAREQLCNKMARIFEMQRQANELKETVGKLLARNYAGGTVPTQLASFTSPQFTKMLAESSAPSSLTARVRPRPSEMQASSKKLLLSPSQFQALHLAITT